MEETPRLKRLSRRDFVRLGLGLAGASALAACAPAPAPTPTPAPAPAQPPPKPAAPAPTTAAAKPAPTAAPAKPAATAAAPAKNLKVGIAISLTGALAREGNLMRNGYQFWADTVNAVGGLKAGNDTYKVEVVFMDDKSDPATSAKLVEKLITEDKVDVIFGSYGSGITEVSSVVSERYRKIMISPLATTPRLFERGFKYLFNHGAAIPKLGGLHAVMWKQLGVKTTAIITPDDVFPLASANVQKSMAEESGIQVVYFQKFPKTAHDMSSVVTDLKRLAPDAVSITGYMENELLFLRQTREQGVNFKYFGVLDSTSSDDYFKILGKDGNYVFSTSTWDPAAGWKDPIFGDTRKYAADFKTKTGKEPTMYDASAASAGTILQQALLKAGSLDPDKMREALLSLDLETVQMPLKYGPNGANTAGTGVVIQVQNQKLVPVYPERIAQAKPMFPTPPWGQR